MPPTEQLYRIVLPYATFGLVTRDDASGEEVVIRAPPIARWTIGKPIYEVVRFYQQRHASISMTCAYITEETGPPQP